MAEEDGCQGWQARVCTKIIPPSNADSKPCATACCCHTILPCNNNALQNCTRIRPPVCWCHSYKPWLDNRAANFLFEFRISCQVTSQLPYQHEIKIRDKILMGVVLVRKDTATHLWKQRLPSIYADVQLLRSCFYILMHTVEMFLYLHKNHFCFPLWVNRYTNQRILHLEKACQCAWRLVKVGQGSNRNWLTVGDKGGELDKVDTA